MANSHDKIKPTILMVPGAWFPPSMYDAFLQVLRKAGYPTVYASYPSLGPKEPLKADAATDTAFVLEDSLLPLVEAEGKDVVIVMHSYGGIPGSAAAKGLAKAMRKLETHKGGVIGLIHVSGFVLPGGASLADGQRGSLPAWVKEDNPAPGLTMPANPVAIFSADIESARAQANASRLIPHATLAFKSPSPAPAWVDSGFEGRLAYLVCTEDQAIPRIGQEAMMQGTGQKWIVKELEGSHTAPFLSKTQGALEAVEGFIHAFSEA